MALSCDNALQQIAEVSEAAESKDSTDAMVQWALERSDDGVCAKIRCEARSEAECQSSEGAEASCEACSESRGLSPEFSGRSEVRSKACIATMGLSSEAAESKDAIDSVSQWALESSDDRGCAKIRSEARSEARCQSSGSCSEAAEAQSVVEALAVRPQTGPHSARQSAEASEAQRCIVEVEVTMDSAPLTPLLRWPCRILRHGPWGGWQRERAARTSSEPTEGELQGEPQNEQRQRPPRASCRR